MSAPSSSMAVTNPMPSAALRWFVTIGRLLLAGVFLFAAWTKMPWVQPAPLFGMQIDSYRVLGPDMVMLVAHILPWFELAVGLLLLIGRPLRFATVIASLTVAGFFALVVRTYAAGLEINCGCFGPGERLGPATLVRDGAFLALSLCITAGAFYLRRRKSSSAS
jgi:uncharacterized membrane protein YphA (DoxX/SURF4 family)